MYRRFAILTILAVYFLIFVGGLVRASGSGMGCPDWPKCFGQWVPPTHESELPPNYQEIFGEKLKGEVIFNPVKTWIEYLNRLVGVAIGLLIIGTFILSIRYYFKTNIKVVYMSFIALILVVFEGWLGAKVVSTELHPLLITLHMLLAIIIVLILIKTLYITGLIRVNNTYVSTEANKFFIIILMILSTGQIVLGTQVREQIDQLYLKGVERSSWISNLAGNYYLHIILAIALVILHSLYAKAVKKEHKGIIPDKMVNILLYTVWFEFLFGAILGVFKMPAIVQPFHLTMGTVIIGLQYLIFLSSKKLNHH